MEISGLGSAVETIEDDEIETTQKWNGHTVKRHAKKDSWSLGGLFSKEEKPLTGTVRTTERKMQKISNSNIDSDVHGDFQVDEDGKKSFKIGISFKISSREPDYEKRDRDRDYDQRPDSRDRDFERADRDYSK